MQYITDKDKNITHVIVPIDEWNRMSGKRGQSQGINPYQPVIDWIETKLREKSPDGKLPTLLESMSLDRPYSPLLTLPTYNLLRTILDDEKLLRDQSGMSRFGRLTPLLSMMYGFALKADARTIAVAYILRNETFLSALRNTENGVSATDAQVFSSFGFDFEKFKTTASSELLRKLYSGHKSEFVFMAMETDIVTNFAHRAVKERVRRDPEVLRLFFYDLFDALNEIVALEPSFDGIFKKYPLVDKLAKTIYPSNTLSGATSRVYKATKEARQIIESDWKKYVDVMEA